MQQYLDAVRDVLETGELAPNRTGIDTLFKHGLMMKFNMADGFPVVTTKNLAWKSAFAEMLGFFKGVDNAADFRALGCKVWDQNANENQSWLKNPHRKGTDDLGRIYGVQARDWIAPRMNHRLRDCVDQLRMVYEDLRQGIDNRREIVSHWNPGEMEYMALPPCHLLYQFGLRSISDRLLLSKLPKSAGRYLDMCVYVRSNDMGLGMPFNIAGYAWLLNVMARITGHLPGELTYFSWNYHIYVNHIEQLCDQLQRAPKISPILIINPEIRTLRDVEESTIDDYFLHGYEHWPAIKMEMAV